MNALQNILENAINNIKGTFNAPMLPDTITENGMRAHSSTGNPLLDFFTQSVRDCEEPIFLGMLRKCMETDPKSTLAMLLHLRDPRGGKGEKLLSIYACLWLRTYKPRTYLLNLPVMIEHGCFKDILKIVELCNERKVEKLGENNWVELEYFAEILKKDCETFIQQEKPTLTLSGKWAPTENTHFDHKKAGRQAKVLACILFPDSKTRMKEYRKMLGNLRENLRVVERLMCQNRWDEIKFGNVPSKAHRLLRNAFGKKQEERYKEYLSNLSKGKEKINVSGTEPHDLVKNYFNDEELDGTIEGQWNELMKKLKESGNLSNSLAVVDVSGSMLGIPILVSISLGIVVSELSTGIFKNKCITFSQKPKLHDIKGSSLFERVNSVKNMEWGMNTDLMAVFDLILEKGKETSDMIETLYIFTDMQFDTVDISKSTSWENQSNWDRQQSNWTWADTYQTICNKYENCGFKVPKIVFWNLRATDPAFPTTKDTPGVALVSGFSPNLLKVFMELGELNPEIVLQKTLEPYMDLVKLHPLEC